MRFAGFDGPLEISAAASPRESLTELYAYLSDRLDADLLPCPADTLVDLLGADDRWTNPAAMMDPAQSVGRSPDAQRLRLLADDLVALLVEQTPHLLGLGAREWERAGLYGRTATGLLSYHFWMADTSPGRIARLLGVRDSMMAANLLALAGRGPLLVHAHNGHLQRDRSSMRMGGEPVEWWSAGAIISAHLGDRYAFLATALGTISHRGVEAPPADTIEGLLYALPADRYLVDPAALAALTPAARVSPWFGYAPLDPAPLGRGAGGGFVNGS